MKSASNRIGVASGDVISLYFKDIASTSLLTPQEEVRLTKQLARGRRAARDIKQLAPDSEAAHMLKHHIRKGEQAKSRLIKANVRLVIKMAYKYRRAGVPLADLIQEGNLGLMKALDRFDPRLGFRLSTYATWWVRQGITRALANQGRTIRLPVHVDGWTRKLRRVAIEFEQLQGHPPSVEELAGEVKLNPGNVKHLLQFDTTPASLQRVINEREGTELGDIMIDEDMVLPADAVSSRDLQAGVEQILLSLDQRESAILRMRFGFSDGSKHTLADIGQCFGITRERVRQIEAGALQKLRQHPDLEQLRDYLS